MYFDICPICYNYAYNKTNADGTVNHVCADESCSYNKEDDEETGLEAGG